MQRAGVDIERLLMCQPDSGEMALEVVDNLVRSGAVDIVVIDSVAALVPRSEIEGEIGAVQGAPLEVLPGLSDASRAASEPGRQCSQQRRAILWLVQMSPWVLAPSGGHEAS